MLDPGTELAGYRIEAYVASGGMGAVYRATQLSLERVVAVKVLSSHLSDDRAFRKRFRREAILQATLEHPHILPVYEAGESSAGLFIAMRYVDGPSLKATIGHVDRATTLRLLAGVAAALDASHAAGLIHRDIKPHNILIVGGQHAYLTDFGLTTATGLSSVTQAGQFLGTLDYISPEQIQDEPLDPRSDVYSLGAVLYEAMTGSVPFPRSSKIAVIYAHLEQAPRPPSEIAPELGAEIDAVLARALAKRPEGRYASAGELVREATAALERGRPQARASGPAATIADADRAPETTTAEAPRPARALGRRRSLVAALALALCVLAGAGGYLTGRSVASPASLGTTRALQADGVSVPVPARWRISSQPVPHLFTGSAASAGPASAPSALVSVGLTRGFGPSMVPQTLRAAVSGVPALGSAVRTSDGTQGRIYRFIAAGRRYEILFVPTGHLVATVACVAPARGGDGGVIADCDRILDGVTIPHPLELDPRPTYAEFLNATLGALGRRATALLAAYRGARGPQQQAQAAMALAAAFTSAGAGFGALIGHGLSAPELGLHFGVRNKLTEIGGIFRVLAAEARRGDRAAYANSQFRLGVAMQDLAARLFELTRSGYTLH